MKKKLLLIISMFMFMTNVNALTFNVDVTNIEDAGSGTTGSVTNINIPNKELDVLFQAPGDEVNFTVTVTNSGDRAGTLRNITVTSNEKNVEYTSNLPENGLAINGNGTNSVNINGKVKNGVQNGTSTSTITLKYIYDEGSCPEGEILSEDETECLCPPGYVRNEAGVCIRPEKDPECEEDEIYNETKKICEKVVPPVDITPENPKTLDNILLITGIFVISGLGIYAILFVLLKSKKARIISGISVGAVTLGLSFTVLAGIFGIDKLLGAVINPIRREKELTINVHETINFLEVWDGTDCDKELTPELIFEGGSGTESDPYQIKEAWQLVCFAKSVNNGTTYEGQFVKQIANIKLNDNLVQKVESNTTEGLNVWTPAGIWILRGSESGNHFFAGTFDGNNHSIGGLYITSESGSSTSKGLFGATLGANIKNVNLVDSYINISSRCVGTLFGYSRQTLDLDNITVSGVMAENSNASAGIGGCFGSDENGHIKVTNTINNMSPVTTGIIYSIEGIGDSDTPNVIFENVVNNGNFRSYGGFGENITSNNNIRPNIYFKNVENHGNRISENNDTGSYAGLYGRVAAQKLVIEDSFNTGNISGSSSPGYAGGLFGIISAKETVLIKDSYNSGNISFSYQDSYAQGVTEDEVNTLRNVNPGGTLGGLVGQISVPVGENNITVRNSFNTGTISGLADIGGLIGVTKNKNDYVDGNTLIDNCYNKGNIFVGDGAAGGLLARSKGTINNSYNKGNITVWGFRNKYVDLYGQSYHTGTPAGGLVGSNNNLTWDSTKTGSSITDSNNEGNIIITAKTNEVTVGGICGFCENITNSTNSGNITANHATQYFDGISFRLFGISTNVTNTGTIKPGKGWQ